MQSKRADVSVDLAELPPERRACKASLLPRCKQTLKGYDEDGQNGMPMDSGNDVGEVAFARRKNKSAPAILSTAVVDAHRDRLPGLNAGKDGICDKRQGLIGLAVVEGVPGSTPGST